MVVSSRHILQQGPVLAALGRTAWSALQQHMGRASGMTPQCPGPVFERNYPPLPDSLLDDFIRFVGGDPRAYRGQVPAHLFPQWSVPLVARTLEGLPYPMLKVVNGGCRMERRGPIPRGERLVVRGQLTQIDQDGRRVLLTQRVTSGTAQEPELLVSEIHAYVPLGGQAKAGAAGELRKPKATVPADAREIARLHLERDAGLSFAKLTGDFNPIHWLSPYAQASGFRHVILHGFGTFALAVEALVNNRLAGDPNQLKVFAARFTRPLLLPKEVGVYLAGSQVYVGTTCAGPAYMAGTFQTEETPS